MNRNQTLLIVDDEPHVLSSIKRLLRREDYRLLTATSAGRALDLLANHDICVTISDHMMPDMDGITFLEKVAAHDPAIVRILITAHASLENAMAAIKRGRIFEYLPKPWSDTALKGTIRRAFEHHGLLEENRRLQELTRQQNEELKTINDNLESLVKTRTEQLEDAVREGVFMLALASEAKDDVTGDHIRRIQRQTYALSRAQGLSEAQAEAISFGSILHDVGKIHIPDAILKKEGPLSRHEFEIMKTHTIAGEKILGRKPFYRIARQIARHHHECWDGSGYPDGLSGESIPLAARIVTIADVYDALVHERPYKPAWPVHRALSVMASCAGRMFDPQLLGVFFELQQSQGQPSRPAAVQCPQGVRPREFPAALPDPIKLGVT